MSKKARTHRVPAANASRRDVLVQRTPAGGKRRYDYPMGTVRRRKKR